MNEVLFAIEIHKTFEVGLLFGFWIGLIAGVFAILISMR